jgi:putative ABC transport system permease protein
MFKSYFRIAFRNLASQKVLSFISLFGLSVGIACFSLFVLYAVNEFSYDGFHKDAANIYRVYRWDETAQGTSFFDTKGSWFTPMPLAPAMKREFQDVENYVRYIQQYEFFMKAGDEGRRENIAWADPSFFSVFSFRLRSGNPATALKNLNSIVLTVDAAKRIFGKTDVIGQTLQVKVEDRFEPFVVTAVAENPPANTSLPFNILCNYEFYATTTYGRNSVDDWYGARPYLTFLQLKPGSRLPANPSLLAAFRTKYYPREEADARKGGWKGPGPAVRYGLEPIRDIHTDMRFSFMKVTPVDPRTIWILLGIAGGLLLIACINFTTLTIGRSAHRAKEVGIRKVIGGTGKALRLQFLSESILLTVIPVAAGLLLADLLLPFFNQLWGKKLAFSAQFPGLAGFIVLLILGVGLLSGSYPALLMSRFRPIAALNKKIKLGGGNLFTKVLVTLQFTLSSSLIICSVVIVRQLHYIQSRNLGFNRENVIVLEAMGVPDTKKVFPLLRQTLSAEPAVMGMASADNGLGEMEGIGLEGWNYNGKPISPYSYTVDPDYVPVLGIQLLAGRNFDPAIPTDTSSSVIINETMMKALGWTPEKSVGQKLKDFFGRGNSVTSPTVIGVAKDINFQDLHKQIESQVYNELPSGVPYRLFVRIRPGDPSKVLAAVQAAWKKIVPDYPLKYNFLDEDLDRFYTAETRLSHVVNWAGGISIFLACLGLLGLAALAAVNRTKEISIRKILGASLPSLISLLSKDFLQLVGIAFLIATPVGWYLMNKWLQDYAYRIHIEWWIFVLTGAAIISIAFLTVSLQVVRASMTNPVKGLRSE